MIGCVADNFNKYLVLVYIDWARPHQETRYTRSDSLCYYNRVCVVCVSMQ